MEVPLTVIRWKTRPTTKLGNISTDQTFEVMLKNWYFFFLSYTNVNFKCPLFLMQTLI